MDEQTGSSVWYVATLAVCILVGVMFIAGMFGSSESIAIAAQ